MKSSKLVIVIHGQTGVGKTDFSLQIARLLSGEIVNADVGQFYTPLSIGTAKPNWKSSDIPHHLFDILDNPVDCTVMQYRALVEKTVQEIWQRKNIPIIVGGSSFYINSLFFPPLVHNNKQGASFSLALPPDDHAWDFLNSIDPIRAANIHPNDIYRIRRALLLWQQTGILPSQLHPHCDPIGTPIICYLARNRDDLYARINARLTAMIADGWIQEVRALLDTPWESFLLKKKLIGYDDIVRFLRSQSYGSEQDLISLVAQKTRNYAKRQSTFWRKMQRSINRDCPDSCTAINLNVLGFDHNATVHQFVEIVDQHTKRFL